MGEALIARRGGGESLFPQKWKGTYGFHFMEGGGYTIWTVNNNGSALNKNTGYCYQKFQYNTLLTSQGTPVYWFRTLRTLTPDLGSFCVPFEYGKELETIYESTDGTLKIRVVSRIEIQSGSYALMCDFYNESTVSGAIQIVGDQGCIWGTYIPI